MNDRAGKRALSALALFALALAPRLYVALAWTREPVWDGHYYDIGARSIAAGRGYVGTEGGPWCHYPVGYSAWLGLAYRLFGAGPWVGPLLHAFTGALTAVLVRELALRASDEPSEGRAFLAGLFVALHPGLVAYTPLLMTEPTSAFVLALAPLAFAWRPGARWAPLASGLLFGLGTLVRPQTILCAPAAFWLAARAASTRLRAGLAIVVSAVAVLVVLPWTARNCTVMDGCAFVSTNGGWNLAIGSFPRATGRFETLRGSDGCTIVTGQVQQDRCWSQRAWGWIGDDPVRWLGLIPKKLGFTFDHESFAIGYLGEADPQRWTETRKEDGRRLLSTVHRALMIAAPLAFVPMPSRRRPRSLLAPLAIVLLAWIGAASDEHPFWPLALAIVVAAALSGAALRRDRGLAYAAHAVGTLLVVHSVFFGEDRYHVVIAPLLCLLAAHALRREETTAAEPAAQGSGVALDAEEPPHRSE